MNNFYTRQERQGSERASSFSRNVYSLADKRYDHLFDYNLDDFQNLGDLQMTRVLLVEDDRTTRRLVTSALGPYCNLIKAGCAGSAAAKYINFEPDIVFLDLELPDNNGHNVLEWMMYNDPQSHVVLFSGNCDDYNVQRALQNGAKGYVPKPFDPKLMMHFICNCPRNH